MTIFLANSSRMANVMRRTLSSTNSEKTDCLPMTATTTKCTRRMVERKPNGWLDSPHLRRSKAASQRVLHCLTASPRMQTLLDRCQNFQPQVVDADDGTPRTRRVLV